MVKKNLKEIFLSASIPYVNRDKKYYETADVIAIRDAVRALATIVIPKARIIWGGHPAITPLIKEIMERMDSDINDHVTLYQSDFFSDKFPKENHYFEDIIITHIKKNREESLLEMRKMMLEGKNFVAAIFIGGMEGVIDEYNLFKEFYPKTPTFPIASTGAAAKIIYDEFDYKEQRLVTDYSYSSLFGDLFGRII